MEFWSSDFKVLKSALDQLYLTMLKKNSEAPRNRITHDPDLNRMQFRSSVNRFEVEISQVHVPERQYVCRENVLAFAEMNFEQL